MSEAEAAAMDPEMDQEMEDMEGHDPEAEENGMDEEDEDGDGEGEHKVFVKKELKARPYTSDTLEQTVAEVDSFTIKNSR